MLTVILTILKIIGITLAVLVGLILLFVLLVGFVPVRYKAAGEYPAEGELKEDVISRRKRDALMNKVKAPELEEGEDPEEEKKPLAIKADAVVSWLLHIVHISVHVDSTGYVATARLFGLFKIYSNDPETVRKKEEKRKKKEEKRRKKEEKARLKAEKKAAGKKEEKKADKIEEKTEKTGEQQAEAKQTEVKQIETKQDETEKSEEKKISSAGKKDASEEKDAADDDYDIFSSTDEDDEDDEGVSQRGIVSKLKNIYNKLVSLHKKYRYVMDMKDDTRVRNGISYAKKKLFLVIKRVLPKKLEGRIAFGMEDPATTGYIMGGACLFYGLWCRNFSLEPDFENKKLEADISLKGRLVMALLVIPAVKVWFNKDIKYIRRKVGKLKKM